MPTPSPPHLPRKALHDFVKVYHVVGAQVEIEQSSQFAPDGAGPLARVAAALFHHDRDHPLDALTPARIVKLELAVVIGPVGSNAPRLLEVALRDEAHHARRGLDAFDHLAVDVTPHLILVEPRSQPLSLERRRDAGDARVVVTAGLVLAPVVREEAVSTAVDDLALDVSGGGGEGGGEVGGVRCCAVAAGARPSVCRWYADHVANWRLAGLIRDCTAARLRGAGGRPAGDAGGGGAGGEVSGGAGGEAGGEAGVRSS
eukprot:scaffold48796_cov49-Phaeocystis_antarctica.AAC.2